MWYREAPVACDFYGATLPTDTRHVQFVMGATAAMQWERRDVPHYQRETGMRPQGEVIAKLDAASKRYGAVLALDRVNLDVCRGEVLALLGPNGAGKTTAISLLLGLLEADTGSAALFGQTPKSLTARRRIGAMLQTTGVPETLTIGQPIALF